jgi:hypothetical protein
VNHALSQLTPLAYAAFAAAVPVRLGVSKNRLAIAGRGAAWPVVSSAPTAAAMRSPERA